MSIGRYEVLQSAPDGVDGLLPEALVRQSPNHREAAEDHGQIEGERRVVSPIRDRRISIAARRRRRFSAELLVQPGDGPIRVQTHRRVRHAHLPHECKARQVVSGDLGIGERRQA